MQTKILTDFVGSHSDGQSYRNEITTRYTAGNDNGGTTKTTYQTIANSNFSTSHGNAKERVSSSVYEYRYHTTGTASYTYNNETKTGKTNNSQEIDRTIKANWSGRTQTAVTRSTYDVKGGKTRTYDYKDPVINATNNFTETEYNNEGTTASTDSIDFRPRSIKFASTTNLVSCEASMKITIPTPLEDVKTGTTSISCKHHFLILTTTNQVGFPYGFPNNDFSLTTIRIHPSESQNSYQSKLIAGENERIASFDSSYTDVIPRVFKLAKNATLDGSANFINEDWGKAHTQKEVYRYDENYNWFTESRDYTVNKIVTTTDPVSYFNLAEYKSATIGSSTNTSSSVENKTYTTGSSVLSQTRGVTYTRLMPFGGQFIDYSYSLDTHLVKSTKSIAESSTETLRARYESRLETQSNAYQSITNKGTTKFLLNNGIVTFNDGINGTNAEYSFGVNGKQPAVQKGYGTSGENFFNIEGVTFPLVGANKGTTHSRISHQGLGVISETSFTILEHPILRRLEQFVQTGDYWWDGSYETYTRTNYIVTTDTTNEGASNVENIDEQFYSSISTFAYKTSNSDETDSFWFLKSRAVTEVSTELTGSIITQFGATYNSEISDIDATQVESTIDGEYLPLIQTQGINRSPLANKYPTRFVGHENVLYFHGGGIDATGGAKSLFLQHQYALSTSMITKDKDESGTLVIPSTGLLLSGTAISTFKIPLAFTMSHVSGFECPNNRYSTMTYIEKNTEWNNSRINVHPWDYPVGATYENGIITKKGESNSKTELDEDENEKTILETTAPQTIASTDYLSKFFSSQNDSIHL